MIDDEFDISILKQLGNNHQDELLSKIRKKKLELDNAHEMAQIESQHGLEYLFDEIDNLE